MVQQRRSWDRRRYMTTREAARLLDRAPQTIAGWVRDGVMEGLDQGERQRPRWLVSRQAVEERRRGSGSATEVTATSREQLVAENARLHERLAQAEQRITDLQADLAQAREIGRQLGTAAQAAVDAAQQSLLPRTPPSSRGT
jgi:transposase